MELSDVSTIGGMVFADDFVGVSNSITKAYQCGACICCKWRLKANVSKSAVVVYARELVKGSGRTRSSKYTYLGVDFTSYGAWEEELQNGRKKMHSITRRLLLISVVRPTLEYGSEVWEGNKAQAAVLESVMIGGAKRILGCLLEVTRGWIHYRVVEIGQS